MTSIVLNTPALTLTSLLVGVVNSGGCGCDWACLGRVGAWRLTAAVGACTALVLPVLAVAAPASSTGVTLLVATTGSDSGNCQVTACASVGYALSRAPSGATISVRRGHVRRGRAHTSGAGHDPRRGIRGHGHRCCHG